MQKKILDTFKIENGRIRYKLQHGQRTHEALAFLNTNISLDKILEIYEKLEREYASENANHEKVFRLTIDPTNIENPLLEIRNLDPLPEVIKLHLKKITESLNQERQFKWSDRSYWDQLIKDLPSGYHDVLLFDSEDQAIETVRCNLYLYDSGLDLVLTPKLDVGCLNGVLRRALLTEGKVDLPQLGYKKIIEQNISVSDLKQASNFYIGNAVRGLLKASL